MEKDKELKMIMQQLECQLLLNCFEEEEEKEKKRSWGKDIESGSDATLWIPTAVKP